MTTYIKKETLLAYLQREELHHGSLYREMMTQSADTHDPLERFMGSVRESIRYRILKDIRLAVSDGTFDCEVEDGRETRAPKETAIKLSPSRIDWNKVGMDGELYLARRSWWSRLWSWLTFRRP